ncbi:MAG: carbohydrate kinase family protein [bacterium]|nr:carbohydrate kinase family protein [bacterium]
MRYDFVSVGDVTTDAFIKLKEGVHTEPADEGPGTELCFRFGDKLEYEQVDIIHGVGNAGNAAVSAARLGATTALVTDIGEDENGDAALSAWQADGVAVDFVRRHKEYPTHYHFVLRFGAERTILIKHQPWPYKIPDFPEPPRWMYFSSVGEHGLEYHHELASYVKAHGVKLAFQPGTFQISLGRDRIKDAYEASEIFFCNKQEAQRILSSATPSGSPTRRTSQNERGNTQKNDTGEFKDLLDSVRALGPSIAVITDGPNGAYASDGTGYWKMPMYPDPAPPVDRTGAGDSFSSTVAAMLAEGLPLQEALRRGPINSMNVVQLIGAQKGLLTREEIEKLLETAPTDYALREL